MELWLDSIDPQAAYQISQLGILQGVTTNPKLLSEARSIDHTLHELIKAQPGSLAVQVVADTVEEMVAQGKILNDLSDQMYIKVPVTKEGLSAIHQLSGLNIRTMATVVFSPEQALLAAKAGADYVALYLGRYQQSGGDPIELLRSTAKIFQNYKVSTKILAASISDVNQVAKCAELGISAVTLKESIFNQLIEENPLTLESLRQFNSAWKAEAAELFKVKTII